MKLPTKVKNTEWKCSKQGDVAHINAMNELQKMMKEPSDFATWFENKKEEFNKLSNS